MLSSSFCTTSLNNCVIYSIGVSCSMMGMEFEECGHGDQTSDVDDDDQDFSISESTNSDWSTWSMAELLSAVDTVKTCDAAESARPLYEEDITTSQRFQTRPEPRVPLALQAVYLKSCMDLVVEEPPPRAAVYISQRSSPQQYLEDSLSERGYSTERFKTLDTGYYREPTPLQLASYDKHVLKMIVLHVHYGNSKGLHDVLSCGISPDACNKYGESLLHRVCKASNKKLLQIFLDHGASVQFANDYGRTPLHEVCLATKPCFINFEQVLKRDPHLIFLTDVLGATPFSYIRKEHYEPWIRHLEGILDVYWPRRCIPEQDRPRPPPMSLEKPRSVPLPDPVNALPLKLAGMVASGKLEFPIR